MQIAMIGLGKMGGNMVRRLRQGGHDVVAFDRDPKAVEAVVAAGARAASSVDAIKGMLNPPRVAWVMVPSGAPTEETIDKLAGSFDAGDVVIDGGNSYFRDSVRRAEKVSAKGVHFIDAGTSGGVWGLEKGYCLMVGGDEKAYAIVEPALRTLAQEGGCARVGKAGAGHFAKMVHNGIEYAMMQSYAEGFELLKASEFGFDLGKLSGVWNHGSVVRSWLLELAESALTKNPELDGLKAYVSDSGEGRWTVNEAVAHAVPVPTIAASLFARFASRQDNAFGLRLLAALRNEFGGHAVQTK